MSGKPKKGHVVRISEDAFATLRDIWPDNLRVAVDLVVQENQDLKARLEQVESAPVGYVLPSAIHESLPKAKGAALVAAARGRSEEKPIQVREIV